MNFVALDFETANGNLHSVCEIGFTVVEEGRIIHSESRLVRPRNNWFSSGNIGVHGITAEDVKNEPEFDEIWNDVKHYFDNNYLVAHNAGFDTSVLKQVLDLYSIELPHIDYSCSVRLARKSWKGLSSYGLKSVSEYLGINLERHHRAGDDAQACAEITLAALEKNRLDTFEEIPKKLGIQLGHIRPGDYVSIFPKSVRPQKALPKVLPEEINHSHEFSGKSFIFTGRLRSMKREEAQKEVLRSAGLLKEFMDRETHYLVVGSSAYSAYQEGKKSRKILQAEEFQNHGYDIEIISEEEFTSKLGKPITGKLF